MEEDSADDGELDPAEGMNIQDIGGAWDGEIEGEFDDADRAHVKSLMVPVTKPGQMANWIAAPARGIHGQDIDFEYVKFH